MKLLFFVFMLVAALWSGLANGDIGGALIISLIVAWLLAHFIY